MKSSRRRQRQVVMVFIWRSLTASGSSSVQPMEIAPPAARLGEVAPTDERVVWLRTTPSTSSPGSRRNPRCRCARTHRTRRREGSAKPVLVKTYLKAPATRRHGGCPMVQRVLPDRFLASVRRYCADHWPERSAAVPLSSGQAGDLRWRMRGSRSRPQVEPVRLGRCGKSADVSDIRRL